MRDERHFVNKDYKMNENYEKSERYLKLLRFLESSFYGEKPFEMDGFSIKFKIVNFEPFVQFFYVGIT